MGSLFIINFKKIKVLTSVFIFLALIELSVRFYIYLKNDNFAMLSCGAPISETNLIIEYPERKLSWKIKPNLNTTYKGKSFSTNSLGFRDGEWLENNKIKVAVLGKSYAMGTGLAEGENWPDQLEDMFNNVEVMNFSVEGYTISQHELLLHRFILGHNPDFLIIPIFFEELDFKIPFFAAPPASFLESSLTVSWWINKLYAPKFLIELNRHFMRTYLGYNWDFFNFNIREKKEVRSYSSYLQSIIQTILKHNIKVVLFPMPVISKLGSSVTNTNIMRLQFLTKYDQDNILLSEGNDDLYRDFSVKDTVFPGDPHPNKEVHLKLAKIIFKDLNGWEAFKKAMQK